MARQTFGTRMDRILTIYREMDPAERPLVAAALRGFDAAVAPIRATSSEQAQFEELGGRVAEESQQ